VNESGPLLRSAQWVCSFWQRIGQIVTLQLVEGEPVPFREFLDTLHIAAAQMPEQTG